MKNLFISLLLAMLLLSIPQVSSAEIPQWVGKFFDSKEEKSTDKEEGDGKDEDEEEDEDD